jgi:BirA family biotin operon repressor/biotin-[acetyl-CoA-carboxylase] ligase
LSHVSVPFDTVWVHDRLSGSRFGRLHFTEQTASTNDDAAAILGTPGSAGSVFVTDFQRAGRGRRARDWIAPPGSGLLFTTVMPRTIRAASLWAVTFWTALCVADGIENATGARVALQWPNDLLLDGRKCCGILCISRVTGDEAAVACGTGINVRRPADDAALCAIEPAPAFLSDVQPACTREALLVAIVKAYEANLALIDEPHTVARLWEARAHLAGTPYAITVDGGTSVVRALARAIDNDGSLIAQVDGRDERFTLADARVVR